MSSADHHATDAMAATTRRFREMQFDMKIFSSQSPELGYFMKTAIVIASHVDCQVHLVKWGSGYGVCPKLVYFFADSTLEHRVVLVFELIGEAPNRKVVAVNVFDGAMSYMGKLTPQDLNELAEAIDIF